MCQNIQKCLKHYFSDSKSKNITDKKQNSVKRSPNKSKTGITIILHENDTILKVNEKISQPISKYFTYLIKATKLKNRFLKESL